MTTTKIFKSGNSVAVRLPKSFGLEAGTEVRVREEQGKYVVERVGYPKKLDLTGIAGSCPGLKPLSPEEREFEPSRRVWDDPDWPGWERLR